MASRTAYLPEKKTQVQVENSTSIRAEMTTLWETFFGEHVLSSDGLPQDEPSSQLSLISQDGNNTAQ
jgi:hypothetical protein